MPGNQASTGQEPSDFARNIDLAEFDELEAASPQLRLDLLVTSLRTPLGVGHLPRLEALAQECSAHFQRGAQRHSRVVCHRLNEHLAKNTRSNKQSIDCAIKSYPTREHEIRRTGNSA